MGKNIVSLGKKMLKKSENVAVLRDYEDETADGKRIRRPILSLEDMAKHPSHGAIIAKLIPLQKFQNIIKALKYASLRADGGIVNFTTGKDSNSHYLTEAILRMAFPPGTTYKEHGNDFNSGGYQHGFGNWIPNEQFVESRLRNLLYGVEAAPSRDEISAIVRNPEAAGMLSAVPVSEGDGGLGDMLKKQLKNEAGYTDAQFEADCEALNDPNPAKGYPIYQREATRLAAMQNESRKHYSELTQNIDEESQPRSRTEYLVHSRIIHRQELLVNTIGNRFRIADDYRHTDYVNRIGGFVKNPNYYDEYKRILDVLQDPYRLQSRAASYYESIKTPGTSNFDNLPEDSKTVHTIGCARDIINRFVMPILDIIATMDPNPAKGYEQHSLSNIVFSLKTHFNTLVKNRQTKLSDFEMSFGKKSQIAILSERMRVRIQQIPQALIMFEAHDNPFVSTPISSMATLNADGTSGQGSKVGEPQPTREFRQSGILRPFLQSRDRSKNQAVVFVTPERMSFKESGLREHVDYVDMDLFPVNEQEAEELIKLTIDKNFIASEAINEAFSSGKAAMTKDEKTISFIGRSLLRKLKSFIIGQNTSVAIKILDTAVKNAQHEHTGKFDKEIFFEECVKASRSQATQIKGLTNAITKVGKNSITLHPTSYIRDYTSTWGGRVEEIRCQIIAYVQEQEKSDRNWDAYDAKDRELASTKDDKRKSMIRTEMKQLKYDAEEFEKKANAKLQGIATLTILYGEPASGKSIFPEALANALGFNYMILDFGEATGGLVGQTEHRTQELLDTMSKMHNTIFLMDEVDGGAMGAGTNPTGYNDTSVAQLKKIQTWFGDNDEMLQANRVKCIGTTNNPEAFAKAMNSRAEMIEVEFNMTPENVYKVLKSSEVHLKRHYPMPPAYFSGWDKVEEHMKSLGDQTIMELSTELSAKKMDFRQLVRWLCSAFSCHENYIDQRNINRDFAADPDPDKSGFKKTNPGYFELWQEQVDSKIITKDQPPRIAGDIALTANNILDAARKTVVKTETYPVGMGQPPKERKVITSGWDVMRNDRYKETHVQNAANKGHEMTQQELNLDKPVADPSSTRERMIEPADVDETPSIPLEQDVDQPIPESVTNENATNESTAVEYNNTPRSTPSTPSPSLPKKTLRDRSKEKISSTDYYYEALLKNGVLNKISQNKPSLPPTLPLKPTEKPSVKIPNDNDVNRNDQNNPVQDTTSPTPDATPVPQKTPDNKVDLENVSNIVQGTPMPSVPKSQTPKVNIPENYKPTIDLPGIKMIPWND